MMHWKAITTNKETKENVTLYLEAKDYTVESLRVNLEEVYPHLEIGSIIAIKDPRIIINEENV